MSEKHSEAHAGTYEVFDDADSDIVFQGDDSHQPLNSAFDSKDKGCACEYKEDETSKKSRRRQLSSTCTYTVLAIFVICGSINLAFLALGVFILQAPEWMPNWGEPGNPGEGLKHYPTGFTRDITPIPAHSHNDYWRRIPFYEAIHYGLTSVEADVWLQEDGELLVGHDKASLTRNRTLRSLYVNPIRDLLDRQNPDNEFSNGTRNGVFDTVREQPLVLLIDLKTDGYHTLPVVQQQLEALREKNYLTYFNGKEVVQGPVQVVMTGDTPFDLLIANTTYRDTFFDAPLDKIWEDSAERQAAIAIGTLSPNDGIRKHSKLKRTRSASSQGLTGTEGITGASFTPENSLYASVSFRDVLGWPAYFGLLDEKALATMRGQIKAAHAQGLKVRYWETPAWPVGARHKLWKILLDEGADVLNADDLKDVARGPWKGADSWWFW